MPRLVWIVFLRKKMTQFLKKTKKSLVIQELTWKEIRGQVRQVSPELSQVIDKLNPGSKYTVFKVRYPYGSSVLKNGNLFLPCDNGEFISLVDADISPGIQEKLGYNLPSPPVMLVLNNTFELCLPLQERIIPYFILAPGGLLGFWQVLDACEKSGKSFDPSGMWEITAGARSMFMLPKISEELRHDKLQRVFGFSEEKPRDFSMHWHIFRSLYKHPSFETQWEAEVLFFSKEWFTHLHDSAWKDLKLYFLEFNWRDSGFWRGLYAWDMIFSRIQWARRIKPSAYHSDIVKHLCAIAMGAVVGFTAASDDSLGPIKRIQEIYENIYGLKTWYPVIMIPKPFLLNESSRPVYYSLQYQTAFSLSTKTKERASIIQDLYAVYSTLEKYLQELKKDYLSIKSTPLYDLIDKINFDFFHSDTSDYSKIKSSSLIPIEDKNFSDVVLSAEKKFPINSLFFNGCIKISRKE